MKDEIIKIRIAETEKAQLQKFATETGKSVSEVVRLAVSETMRGHVAGQKRRQDIANLRRSVNLMLQAFAGKPIDIPMLQKIAAQVRRDAGRVVT